MKAVIPAKGTSTRVPEKNFRDFYEGKSIIDILAEKLLKLLPAQDIYISSDDNSVAKIADKLGINFHLRDEYLTRNSTPMNEVVQGVCLQLPMDDAYMWCQATEPLFNEYDKCLKIWHDLDKSKYDSLAVCYPIKRFLLDQNHKPMGFGFGPWHNCSQDLPQMYQLNFTMGILTRDWIEKCGYHVGGKPYWYESEQFCIDIDDMDDWELAKMAYQYKMNKKEGN
ncbi:MAG: hypothetical protein FWC91_04715 [Defluviitaleaceae bacterium]|nr:hypothetical protein [Defluviitaleaceae bacterium]